MKILLLLSLVLVCCAVAARAQSLGNAGTIEGTVVDPSGAAVAKAQVTLHNVVSGYNQTTTSGTDGAFRLSNIPANPYHLEITAPGFNQFGLEVDIKSSVPVQVKATMAVAGAQTTIQVEGAAEALETDPSAHVDVDRTLMLKLPAFDAAGGLSQAIIYSTGGVAADGNGFFHPLGDHAQAAFVIDGQPISDQQSKVFSTQLPTSAIQSMEVTTGTPNAEFGDKSSLITQITTRSGLGAGRVFGNLEGTWGSFTQRATDGGPLQGLAGGNAGLGYGTAKFGNFLGVEGLTAGRFLDTPEFRPFHDTGNNASIFDRMDFQPTGKDALHLNIFLARNWFQIPNSLDQVASSQDQKQRVLTWSVAPGYQHVFSAHTVLSINPYMRKDQLNYYASRDPFADTPTTQSQSRQLLNWGVKADVSTTQGRNVIKYGIDAKQTRLLENFGFGITDPTLNDPCVNPDGSPVGDPTIKTPGQCAAAGYEPNTADNPDSVNPFSVGLAPFDLTRGGKLFAYHATGNINQVAFYAQDGITLGSLLVNIGFRFDRYDGLTSKSSPQPRLGLAYNIKGTGTVLRAAYARTFETPFNENLLLSNATGLGGLAANVFGSVAQPIEPGFRNQFNTGLQQALGKFILVDADYFWKYTHGAYDFNTLFATNITFPISWHNSKLDGVTGRVSTTSLKGFQAYWTFGHTRARYYPPETGGLISQGAPLASGVFRIDHDQAFQSTLTMRYQRPKNAEWVSFTYRFDSGLVVSGVPDAGFAMSGLTPNQQVSIGLACNGVFATVDNPISDCVNKNGSQGTVTSKLLTLPQGGYDNFDSKENDDHNPDRVKPRNVLNLGFGTDNLLHTEKKTRLTASLAIDNLTNVVALYNFLSTFSGTHFLQPRTLVAKFGVTF
ncbi:MAG TPA: carboxypeptidase regulatory-like domain-containing protein [Bryobacteraceae bacterium]|nr:carboxypeptidase regulatory-like domain-containing protein [Bryobacteraceae bacterium]